MSKKAEKEKNQHIQVFVRCRPLNSKERRQGGFAVVDVSDREVHVKERNNATASTKTFSFDKVFAPNSKQIDVHKQTVSPLVDEVLSGYNCTMFAYGQTGTGKTYTMEGERSENYRGLSWEDDPLAGIIPRAMHQLFTRLVLMGCEFSVRVSYLEIYNEELIDLLGAESVENPRLRIYEDATRKGSCIIQGMEEVVVRGKNEVYKIMEQGSQRRQTAATQLNAHSSRSHSLFMVTVHIKENSVDGEEMLKTGKLNLVDLAGSECIGRSGAVDKRAREAGNINQSLLTLGRVITALLEHTPHVPYRESKLTRLLQDSLGGRTKTSIIATISPSSINVEETLSTLDYAFRAKNITNRPEINQRLSKKTLLKEYNEEIERLRRDLQATRDKNGVFLAQENYDELQTKIQQQRDTILDYTERISMLSSEMMKINEMFDETKEVLASTENDLMETKGELKHTEGVLDKTRLNYQIKIQDCDEQRYLVSKQVGTETHLASEASQLMSTANEATSDVRGLHAKLDRKRHVDEQNDMTVERFRVTFRENIDSMKASVYSFTEGQVASATASKNAIGSVLARRSGEVSTLCGDLGNLVETLKSRIERLEEEEARHLVNSQEWAADIRKSCLQSKDSEVSRQSDFHEHTFMSSMVEIQTALSLHITSLRQLASAQQAQMEMQQAQITRFAGDIEHRLRTQDSLAKSMANAMEVSLAGQKQQVQHIEQAQDNLNKDLTEKFLADMTKMLAEMVTKQQNSLTSNLAPAMALQSTMLNEVQHFGSAAASSIDEAIGFTQRSLTDTNTLAASQSKESIDLITKECEEANRIIEHQNKLQANVSTFTQQTREYCFDRANQVLDKVDQHTTALSIACTAHKEGIQAATEECESAVEATKVQQADQHAALTRDLEEQQSELSHLNNNASEWLNKMVESLQGRDAHVERLLTEDTQKDKPTGTTPKPRDFSYPRTLSRTDSHSLILRNFRRSYVLREVTDLPLPCDSSFGSGVSEVGMLDLDADIDQNASADSAFSTASYASSTIASEQPDLEELTPMPAVVRPRVGFSDDVKENDMKPPKVSTIAKTQRTTHSRSRSRTDRDASSNSRDRIQSTSNCRTPQKKVTATNCKTPTAQSVRQSRARLPLRPAKTAN